MLPSKEKLIEILRLEGIHDEAILTAIQETPRELFVRKMNTEFAYANVPLPIDCEQTISQPYVVAKMTQALLAAGPLKKVLEIGTGSGYQAAILAKLVDQVYTVERNLHLLKQALQRFESLQLTNIHCQHADGLQGWVEHAPFDGIIVTAAATAIPPKLIEQLADKGRMVIPVDDGYGQEIRLIKKHNNELFTERLDPVLFVPLLSGKE